VSIVLCTHEFSVFCLCACARRLLLTLVEVASAMAYLHRMGIVHCDIKPGNVLLRSSHLDPRGFTTKLSDFGGSGRQF